MRRRSTARRTLLQGALVLACAALALASAGCAAMARREPIEVHVARLTPLASTAFEHRLRVDLRLRNPNPRAYQIDGLRFVLDVNGRRLASGLANESATLPRLGEVVVPVTTTTTLLDLVNQIVVFGQRPQPRFEYAIRGKLFLKGWGSIPFDHHGSDRDLLPRSASSPSSASESDGESARASERSGSIRDRALPRAAAELPDEGTSPRRRSSSWSSRIPIL